MQTVPTFYKTPPILRNIPVLSIAIQLCDSDQQNSEKQSLKCQLPAMSGSIFFFLQSIRRNKMSGPSMDFRKAVEMSGCQLGIKRRECLTAISVSIWKSFEFLTKWFHTCLRTMQKQEETTASPSIQHAVSAGSMRRRASSSWRSPVHAVAHC